MAADIKEEAVKVRQWRNRGNIPVEYWPKIIECAEAKGFTLTADDFLKAITREASTSDDGAA